eukprot:14711032-Alexandrium_andersonii.AAC.1
MSASLVGSEMCIRDRKSRYASTHLRCESALSKRSLLHMKLYAGFSMTHAACAAKPISVAWAVLPANSLPMSTLPRSWTDKCGRPWG